MIVAKGDDIQERLINFAVAIIELVGEIPNTVAGRHVAGQLVKSGTSPAPNYSEARGAESRKDFIHKLGIVLKELNESDVWLVILIKSKLLPEPRVKPILKECRELSKIINQSIKTAKSKIIQKN